MAVSPAGSVGSTKRSLSLEDEDYFSPVESSDDKIEQTSPVLYPAATRTSTADAETLPPTSSVDIPLAVPAQQTTPNAGTLPSFGSLNTPLASLAQQTTPLAAYFSNTGCPDKPYFSTSASRWCINGPNNISPRRDKAFRDVVLNRDDTDWSPGNQSQPSPSTSRPQPPALGLQHGHGVQKTLEKIVEASNHVERYSPGMPCQKPPPGPSSKLSPLSASKSLPLPPSTPLTPSVKRPRPAADDLGDTPPAKQVGKYLKKYGVRKEYEDYMEHKAKSKMLRKKIEELEDELVQSEDKEQSALERLQAKCNLA
ncbi:uncharacterized protein NECHADRAFT_88861 [Fusarium vanettenii 77-13-4]|uniref:Uncharacterized protein n=1 Tax=Fusarium vanettenii (strain ATCC MYA-4622 / CBS 123669 / FGSC 9596 / NRRL 45880 / 77-13-4) TaxID=660122 RepID=C7ZN45_FUSV7|nr:uncharacterized protein NECHADRAFT_88861 [Fusarium vanettenii 77-13-4]EEU34571.1 predicted protein [Fusarium vanettenii 77-13-4]